MISDNDAPKRMSELGAFVLASKLDGGKSLVCVFCIFICSLGNELI